MSYSQYVKGKIIKVMIFYLTFCDINVIIIGVQLRCPSGITNRKKKDIVEREKPLTAVAKL